MPSLDQHHTVLHERTIQVRPGLEGTADLAVRADGRSWMRFLAKERGLLGALLRRRIRLRGNPRLLLALGRCFPS
jgi:putative sterol carrier protein